MGLGCIVFLSFSFLFILGPGCELFSSFRVWDVRHLMFLCGLNVGTWDTTKEKKNTFVEAS